MDAVHVRDLGLREAEDPEIFERARGARVVVFTKDEDFDIVAPSDVEVVELTRRWSGPA